MNEPMLRDHSQLCEHRYVATHVLKDDGMGGYDICPGGREVTLKEAGSMARSWRCLNCGDSHEDTAGCDEPDFDYMTFYTIEDAALGGSDE